MLVSDMEPIPILDNITHWFYKLISAPIQKNAALVAKLNYKHPDEVVNLLTMIN